MSHFIPNSFQIPNAFVDEVMGRISGNAVKCYLLVARKTTGWQKESDFISTSQFMALTKIKDKRTVYAVIKELEEIGLIRTLKEGGRVTEFYLEKSLPVAKNDTGGRKKQNNSVDKVVAENDTGYLDSDDDKCNQSQNMSLVAENVTTLVAKNAPGTSSKKCYPTKYNINTNINNNPPISPLGDVLAYLNGALSDLAARLGKRKPIGFKLTDSTKKSIKARLAEYSLEDCFRVVDYLVEKWGQDEKMSEYLRPSTIFRQSNFAEYVSLSDRWDSNGRPRFENGCWIFVDGQRKPVKSSSTPNPFSNDTSWADGKKIKIRNPLVLEQLEKLGVIK